MAVFRNLARRAHLKGQAGRVCGDKAGVRVIWLLFVWYAVGLCVWALAMLALGWRPR